MARSYAGDEEGRRRRGGPRGVEPAQRRQRRRGRRPHWEAPSAACIAPGPTGMGGSRGSEGNGLTFCCALAALGHCRIVY